MKAYVEQSILVKKIPTKPRVAMMLTGNESLNRNFKQMEMIIEDDAEKRFVKQIANDIVYKK